MTKIKLGENSKLAAPVSERKRIQTFYRDVLGCKVVMKDGVDLVWLGDNFHIGYRYEDSALSDEEMLKSIWLELRVGNPDDLRRKILDFGIEGLDFWDKEHFYFQAPGGQVFRLVGVTEDMSKWKS